MQQWTAHLKRLPSQTRYSKLVSTMSWLLAPKHCHVLLIWGF